MKTTAIVLAAGRGKRMETDIPKQYIKINEKPVLYYSLKVFEESFIDEIILVVGKGDVEYCKKEIVQAYDFRKVIAVIEGGAERYHSVYNGLRTVNGTDYIFIHDGARPFITQSLLADLLEEVKKNNACVAAVPVKDTIKKSDKEGYVVETPDRSLLWSIQTPQVFEYSLVLQAYNGLLQKEDINVTDDAMVVETVLQYPIKLVKSDYKNIKLTTPEDIYIAKQFLAL